MEEEKRVAIQSSKDTKIKLINADIINKVKSNHSGVDSLNNTDKPSSSNDKLRFFDEEYPTLDEKKSRSKTVSSKSKEKYNESGSEWETEDENEDLKTVSDNLANEGAAAARLENESDPAIGAQDESL